MVCQLLIHGPLEGSFTSDVCDTPDQMKRMTVGQLKQKITQKLPAATNGLEGLQLTHVDQRLDKDEALLSDYGIQHKSHIHLVQKVPGGLKA